MSSGKQTSFQFGEISKENHYRSNDASYANSLYKLTNMKVKRQGGVERILGTEMLGIVTAQDNIAENRPAYQRYKRFSYRVENSSNPEQIDYRLITLHMKTDGSAVVTITVGGASSTGFSVPNASEGLAKVRMTAAKDKVFLHGLMDNSFSPDQSTIVVISDLKAGSPTIGQIQLPTSPIPSAATPTSQSNRVLTGTFTNYRAVTYLVTAILADGTEVVFRKYTSTNGNANGFLSSYSTADIVFPGDGIVTGLGFGVAATDIPNYIASSNPTLATDDIKFVNVYRCHTATSGEVTEAVLAYRQPVFEGSMPFSVAVNDAGASITSITAPIDFKAFIKNGSSYRVEGSTCSCIYQDRHVIGFRKLTNPSIEAGDMIATRVGAHVQIPKPIISRPADTFQFSIPEDDKSPVRALINAPRLVCLSDNAAYLIQGGEAGIITPTQINPTKIYSEGCSVYVAPLQIGQYVLYVNSNNTKLIGIRFSGDSVEVLEASLLSSHLIEDDTIIEMKPIPGPDTSVALLRKDGTLVVATVTDSGVIGFSEVDTGAVVETMCLSGQNDSPYLYITGIRNGIRFTEGMYQFNGGIFSESGLRPKPYSNAVAYWGQKLLRDRLDENGFPKTLQDSSTDFPWGTEYEYINITSATTFATGETLQIVSSVAFSSIDEDLDRIKFFYEDDDGAERYLYLRVDASTEAVLAGPTYRYDCTADIDVPAYLQDVDGQGLDTEEENKRKSRFLLATKRLTSSVYTDPLWLLYLAQIDGAAATPTTPDGEVEVDVFAEGQVLSAPLDTYKDDPLVLKKTSSLNPHVDLPVFVTDATVGIPYESYMQTLPIEPSDNRTLTNAKLLITRLGLAVYNTIGGFVGLPDKGITEMAPLITRDDLDPANPDAGYTGYLEPSIPGEWTQDGMIAIKHVEPTPMTILSVYPKGTAGE